MSVQSINPATGEVLETFRETAPDALARILEGADAASREWRRSPVVERAERLRAAARVLRERKDAYARTMSLEMGKPLAQGVGEAEKCAWVCDYYADHGAAFLADEGATSGSKPWVLCSPSCPGISRSGRCFASLHRPWSPGTPAS